MKYVITDFGKLVELKKKDPWHGEEYTVIVYQYGVWRVEGDTLSVLM